MLCVLWVAGVAGGPVPARPLGALRRGGPEPHGRAASRHTGGVGWTDGAHGPQAYDEEGVEFSDVGVPQMWESPKGFRLFSNDSPQS